MYGQVRSYPQVKIQIPFSFANANPVTASNIGLVGAVNGGDANISLTPNLEFGPGELRYDGIQLTDFGSVVTAGGTTGRYKGVIEYTARGDRFLEFVHKPGVGIIQTRPSITGEFTSIDGNGFPSA